MEDNAQYQHCAVNKSRQQPSLFTRGLPLLFGALISILALTSCSTKNPKALITQASTPIPTEPDTTEILTPPPTETPEPTATAVPTPEPTATTQPTPTLEPTATTQPTPPATPSAAPTVPPTPEPTATPAPTAEPTALPAPAPTATMAPAPKAAELVQPTPGRSTTGDTTHLNPNYKGAIKAVKTENGLTLPVRNISPDHWQIITPCFQIANITKATPVLGQIDILIDPGHGGTETGAVAPNGLREADINLDVSLILAELLEQRGYRVELTRRADHRIAIQTRGDLALALNPQVFISIHHNGGPTTDFDHIGAEVYTQYANANSTRLGALIFEEITNEFQDVDIAWVGNEIANGSAWRRNTRGTDLYGVLRRTSTLTSVLTEAMYMTNAAEAQLLSDPATLQREAHAIAKALDRYFTTTDHGSGTIEGIDYKGQLGSGGGTDGCVDPDLD